MSDNKDTYVELVAKVINIKPETTTVDIKADNELYVYAMFVSQVQNALESGDTIFTALRKAREYCLGLGVSSSLLDKWEEAQDMYLEEFSYYDEVARQSYIKGELRGEIKGELRGEIKGELKARLETARELLTLGLPYEQIVKATKLDISNVYKLAGEVV